MDNLNRLEDLAAAAIVSWMKDVNLSNEIKMIDAVNAFMKASGADDASNQKAIIDRRRICAYQILRDCIRSLDTEDSRLAERKLMHIVEHEAPSIRNSMKL